MNLLRRLISWIVNTPQHDAQRELIKEHTRRLRLKTDLQEKRLTNSLQKNTESVFGPVMVVYITFTMHYVNEGKETWTATVNLLEQEVNGVKNRELDLLKIENQCRGVFYTIDCKNNVTKNAIKHLKTTDEYQLLLAWKTFKIFKIHSLMNRATHMDMDWRYLLLD